MIVFPIQSEFSLLHLDGGRTQTIFIYAMSKRFSDSARCATKCMKTTDLKAKSVLNNEFSSKNETKPIKTRYDREKTIVSVLNNLIIYFNF